MKRWYIPLGLLVALGVAAAGYWGFHSARPAASQVQAAPPTVAAERGAVSLGVTAPGRLVGKREMVLSFGATGKLVDLSVRAGQHVEKGATLARLDPAPLQERVTTAQTELELARARLAKLQAGPTTADTAAAQGDLARAQARLDELNRGSNAGDLAAARRSGRDRGGAGAAQVTRRGRAAKRPIRAGNGQEQPVERAGGARRGLRRAGQGRV